MKGLLSILRRKSSEHEYKAFELDPNTLADSVTHSDEAVQAFANLFSSFFTVGPYTKSPELVNLLTEKNFQATRITHANALIDVFSKIGSSGAINIDLKVLKELKRKLAEEGQQAAFDFFEKSKTFFASSDILAVFLQNTIKALINPAISISQLKATIDRAREQLNLGLIHIFGRDLNAGIIIFNKQNPAGIQVEL